MSKTKQIIINKIGADHIFSDTNNQDFYISLPNAKIVLDGCGSCRFSEVGVRLFGQLLMGYKEVVNHETFEEIVGEIFTKLCAIDSSDNFLYDNLCFTILACFETEEEYVLLTCGDGYILAQSENVITPLKLDDGEFPKYYGYNYVKNKEILKEYKEGVRFEEIRFSKNVYTNVGVATDGFRFYEQLGTLESNKLFTFLSEGKKAQIGMLINRNSQIFKDDITICF